MTVFCFNLVSTVITGEAFSAIDKDVHAVIMAGDTGLGPLYLEKKKKEYSTLIDGDKGILEAYAVQYEKHVDAAYDRVKATFASQGKSIFVPQTQRAFNDILTAEGKSHKIALTTFKGSITLVSKVLEGLAKENPTVEYSNRVGLIAGGLLANNNVPCHRKKLHLQEAKDLFSTESEFVLIERERVGQGVNLAGKTVNLPDNTVALIAVRGKDCDVAIQMSGNWNAAIKKIATDKKGIKSLPKTMDGVTYWGPKSSIFTSRNKAEATAAGLLPEAEELKRSASEVTSLSPIRTVLYGERGGIKSAHEVAFDGNADGIYSQRSKHDLLVNGSYQSVCLKINQRVYQDMHLGRQGVTTNPTYVANTGSGVTHASSSGVLPFYLRDDVKDVSDRDRAC